MRNTTTLAEAKDEAIEELRGLIDAVKDVLPDGGYVRMTQRERRAFNWAGTAALCLAHIDTLRAASDPAPRLLFSTTSREAADERIRCAVRDYWNVIECIEDASGLINIIFEKAQVL
jgi:hypothetical protein